MTTQISVEQFQSVTGIDVPKGVTIDQAVQEWRFGTEYLVPFREKLLTPEFTAVPKWAAGNIANKSAFYVWLLAELSNMCTLTEFDFPCVREFVQQVATGEIEAKKLVTCPVDLADVQHSQVVVQVGLGAHSDPRSVGQQNSAVLVNESGNGGGGDGPPLTFRFSLRYFIAPRNRLCRKYGALRFMRVEFAFPRVNVEEQIAGIRASTVAPATPKPAASASPPPKVTPANSIAAVMQSLATYIMEPTKDNFAAACKADFPIRLAKMQSVVGAPLFLGPETENPVPWAPVCVADPSDVHSNTFVYSSVPLEEILQWCSSNPMQVVGASRDAPLYFLHQMSALNTTTVRTIVPAPKDIAFVDDLTGQTNRGCGRISSDAMRAVVARYKERYPKKLASDTASLAEAIEQSDSFRLGTHRPTSARRLTPFLPHPDETPELPDAVCIRLGGMEGLLLRVKPGAKGGGTAAVELGRGVGLEIPRSMVIFEPPGSDEILDTLEIAGVARHAPATLTSELIHLFDMCARPTRPGTDQAEVSGPGDLYFYFRTLIVGKRPELDGNFDLADLVFRPNIQQQFLSRILGLDSIPASWLNKPSASDRPSQLAFWKHPIFLQYVLSLNVPMPKSAELYGVPDFTQTLAPHEIIVPNGSGGFVIGPVAVCRTPAMKRTDLATFTAVKPPVEWDHLQSVIVFSARGTKPIVEHAFRNVDSYNGAMFNVFWDASLLDLLVSTPPTGSPAKKTLVSSPASATPRGPLSADIAATAQRAAAAAVANVGDPNGYCSLPSLLHVHRRLVDVGAAQWAAADQIADVITDVLDASRCTGNWPEWRSIADKLPHELPPTPHYHQGPHRQRRHSKSLHGQLHDAVVEIMLNGRLIEPREMVKGGSISIARASHAFQCKLTEMGDEIRDEESSAMIITSPAAIGPPTSYGDVIKFLAEPAPFPSNNMLSKTAIEIARRRWQIESGVHPRARTIERAFFSELVMVDEVMLKANATLRIAIALEAWRVGAPFTAWYLLHPTATPNFIAEGKRARQQSYASFFSLGISKSEREALTFMETAPEEQRMRLDAASPGAKRTIEDAERAALLGTTDTLKFFFDKRNGTATTPTVASGGAAGPGTKNPDGVGKISMKELGIPKSPELKLMKLGEQEGHSLVIHYSDYEPTPDATMRHLDLVVWFYSRFRGLTLQGIFSGHYPKGTKSSKRLNNWTAIFALDSAQLPSQKKFVATVNDRLKLLWLAKRASERSKTNEFAVSLGPQPAKKNPNLRKPQPKPAEAQSPSPIEPQTTMDAEYRQPPKEALKVATYQRRPLPARSRGSYKTTYGGSYESPSPVVFDALTRPTATHSSETRTFETTYGGAFSPERVGNRAATAAAAPAAGGPASPLKTPGICSPKSVTRHIDSSVGQPTTTPIATAPGAEADKPRPTSQRTRK